MARYYLAIVVFLAALPPAYGFEGNCKDLSGHYAFFGAWERQSFEGGKPDSIAAFTAANPEPRLDRFALGFYARELINPVVAMLRHDTANGVIELDALADSERLALDVTERKLPVKLALVCDGSGWGRDVAASGGGENTPSTIHKRIVLWVDSNGDLLAQGHSDISSGWIFKTRSSSDWLARFRRTEDSPKDW